MQEITLVNDLNIPALLVVLGLLLVITIVGIMIVLAVRLVRQYLDSRKTAAPRHEGWPVQNHPNPQQKFGMFRKK